MQCFGSSCDHVSVTCQVKACTKLGPLPNHSPHSVHIKANFRLEPCKSEPGRLCKLYTQLCCFWTTVRQVTPVQRMAISGNHQCPPICSTFPGLLVHGTWSLRLSQRCLTFALAFTTKCRYMSPKAGMITQAMRRVKENSLFQCL